MSSCAAAADLLNGRTENDKKNMQLYKNENATIVRPPSLISTLAPQFRAQYLLPKPINTSAMYSYTPMPPMASKGVCVTPGPYYTLGVAYNEQVGPDCINFGQDLNYATCMKK